ncbi:MAG: DUF1858 domain-containing protein [Cyanobacteriota bacterium]
MSENKITNDMSIIEIAQNYPETLEVFAKFGLGCIGCAAARYENVEAGARVHGIDPDLLVSELNKAISS